MSELFGEIINERGGNHSKNPFEHKDRIQEVYAISSTNLGLVDCDIQV